jgi:Rad3-related DNA helicase
VVTVLDRRLGSKRYGSLFIESLPETFGVCASRVSRSSGG